MQRPHPPVLVGGSGPNVARRVLDFGDEWMPHAGMPPEELSARITALRRTARDADRSREVPVTVFGAELAQDVKSS
jgi:alkanesulfonate monooxygenase SsuD/methylene tetrahydromethanopterin reductase-like flavin-dependent oxidoreductase (luciferase family)